MKNKILLTLISGILLTSCSSTYRNGQTPDDVYYSPVKTFTEEETQKDENRDQPDQVSNQQDRQIRMARYDRRWRDLDYDCDCDCHYHPYGYGYNYGYYYNPYYYPYPVYNYNYSIRDPKNNTPRTTNLGSYQYTNVETVNPKTGVVESSYRGRVYNQSNNGTRTRETITPSNNNTPSNNTRTYTPAPSAPRSSGTPVTRPGKG